MRYNYVWDKKSLPRFKLYLQWNIVIEDGFLILTQIKFLRLDILGHLKSIKSCNYYETILFYLFSYFYLFVFSFLITCIISLHSVVTIGWMFSFGTYIVTTKIIFSLGRSTWQESFYSRTKRLVGVINMNQKISIMQHNWFDMNSQAC